MERMLKIALLLVVIMFAKACDKEGYEGPEQQPVYFEYHYINHAWGYNDHGWLVDMKGNIWRFEFPENFNTALHGDYLTLGQLEHNLAQCDSVVGEVSLSRLEKKIKLISGAAEGEIDDVHRQGADMGLGVYSCYRYDPNEDAYEYILLSADGDYQQHNHSPEAEKLVEWLSELED